MSDEMNKDRTETIEQAEKIAPVDESRRKLAKAGVAAPFILSVASRPVWADQCSISGAASGPHSGEAPVSCTGCTPGYWKNHPNNWPWHEMSSSLPGLTDAIGACSPLDPGSSASACKVYLNDGFKFDDVFPGAQGYLLDGIVEEGYWDTTLKGGSGGWKQGDYYTYRNLPNAALAPVGSNGEWGVHGNRISLMQVLWLEKSGQNSGSYPVSIAFAFHLVAAYLNALSFPTTFGYNGPKIVELYNNAMAGIFPDGTSPATLEGLKDMLDFMNNRGCPY